MFHASTARFLRPRAGNRLCADERDPSSFSSLTTRVRGLIYMPVPLFFLRFEKIGVRPVLWSSQTLSTLPSSRPSRSSHSLPSYPVHARLLLYISLLARLLQQPDPCTRTFTAVHPFARTSTAATLSLCSHVYCSTLSLCSHVYCSAPPPMCTHD